MALTPCWRSQTTPPNRARRSVSRVLSSARIRRSAQIGDHSSGMPVARHLLQPTRTGSRDAPVVTALRRPNSVPIRSCSRRGLPCLLPYGRSGGLLPHRFTLTHGIFQRIGRSVLCGAIPRVTPGGCYPPPCLCGARTFLPRTLSSLARAAAQPSGTGSVERACGRSVKPA